MSLRILSILGLVICGSVLAAAIYVEQQYMLAACPLCVLQRMVYAALGVTFLFGIIFNFSGILRYVYLTTATIMASLGTAIAARQFWLQYFAPPQKTSCAASLEHLMSIYPILEVLKIALNGSAECANVDFTILTISIAGWSLFIFGSMLIVLLYLIYATKKRRI